MPLPERPGSAGTQVLSPAGDRVAASPGQGGAVLGVWGGGSTHLPIAVSAVYGWRDGTHLVVEVPDGILLLRLDGAGRRYATRTGDAVPHPAGITRVAP